MGEGYCGGGVLWGVLRGRGAPWGTEGRTCSNSCSVRWYGPCEILTPVLEPVVGEAEDKAGGGVLWGRCVLEEVREPVQDESSEATVRCTSGQGRLVCAQVVLECI